MAQDDNFADRLKRIQERAGANPDAPAEAPSRGGSKKTAAMLVFGMGFVLLAGAAVVMLEKSPAIQNFRDSVADLGNIDLAGELGIPSIQDAMFDAAVTNSDRRVSESRTEAAAARAANLIAPSKPPYPTPATEPFATGRMGSVFRPSHAVDPDQTPVAIDTVISGFQPTGPNTNHGSVELVDVSETCTLRPINAGEKLVNVLVGRSDKRAPIQLLQAEWIDETIYDSTKEALSEGLSLGMIEASRGTLAATDVIVTDTSGPLYLLLQSSGRMLWNIHAAPDVNIAHVAIVSGGTRALTGNIGAASFEMLRASDFGQRIDFHYHRGEPEDEECMAWPYRKPDESWGAWAGAQGGNTMDGNLLFGQNKGFEFYDYWLNTALGVRADQDLISANQASSVLVGPMPAAPFAAPASDQPLYTAPFDTVLTGSEADREAELLGMFSTRVTAAAGGDYRDVLPSPLELGPAPGPEAIAATVEGGQRSMGDHIMNSNDIDSKVSLTELNRERKVSFTTILQLADMLEPGEAMPPEELRLTYALMRAPRAMLSFCEDTLVEIGSKCGVLGTTVNQLEEGNYQVRADFAYIPNYPIGTVERRRGGEFLSAFLPDTFSEAAYQTPEERRAFLVTMKDVCERLRAEYGNCVIGTAGFYLDRPARFSGSGTRSNAAGWVEVYLVDNPFEEEQFDRRANEILAELQGL